METKTCSKCKCEKPLDAFYKDRKGRGGLCARCKTCTITATREWSRNNPDNVAKWKQAYRARHKDKIAAYNAQYWATPHARELGRIASSRYYEKNKAAVSDRTRKQREELADRYVVSKIVENTNIPRDQVPRELIELKRLHLAIKRKLKDEQHHRPA